MSTLFGNKPLTSISGEFFRHGCWVMDVTSPNDLGLGKTDTLTIDDIKYKGTVVNSSNVGPGTYKARIVGGKGNMSSTTTAHNYVSVTGRTLLSELLSDKETLGIVPGKILSYKVKNWERLNNVPIGLQVSRFIERFPNVVWRMDTEGNVTVVEDNQNVPTILPKDSVPINNNFDGSISYSVPRLTNLPQLGSKTKQGFIIEQIGLVIDGKTKVFTLYKTSITKALDTLTNRLHRDSLQRSYPCKVISQNSDGPSGSALGGTLSVYPDDPRIQGNGLNKVQIKGVPGALYKVPPNVRCFIQFHADDPERPFVAGFETSDFSNFSSASAGQYYISFGNPSTAQFVALSEKVDTEIDKIWDLLTSWVPVAQDGGAALQLKATQVVAGTDPSISAPATTACTRLKTE